MNQCYKIVQQSPHFAFQLLPVFDLFSKSKTSNQFAILRFFEQIIEYRLIIEIQRLTNPDAVCGVDLYRSRAPRLCAE
jgi:hypothetical protein